MIDSDDDDDANDVVNDEFDYGNEDDINIDTYLKNQPMDQRSMRWFPAMCTCCWSTWCFDNLHRFFFKIVKHFFYIFNILSL